MISFFIDELKIPHQLEQNTTDINGDS